MSRTSNQPGTDRTRRRTWKFFLLRSSAICVLSTLVATGYALTREIPWLPNVEAIQQRETEHAALRETVGVLLPEFLALIDQGAIVIDARSADDFSEGRLAAPQTIVLNVPAHDVYEHLTQLDEFRGSHFVMYCSSEDCDLAEEVYLAMTEAGFEPELLHIYFPGWQGILEAGLDVVSDYSLTAAYE